MIVQQPLQVEVAQMLGNGELAIELLAGEERLAMFGFEVGIADIAQKTLERCAVAPKPGGRAALDSDERPRYRLSLD